MTAGLAALTASLVSTAVACGATPLPNRPPGQTTTRRSARARKILVAVEVAVSVVLLVGAGLIGRSLVRLIQIDIGVPRAGTTVTLLDLPVSGERALGDSRLLADRIVDRVLAAPGVEAAGLGAAAPPNLTRLRVTLTMPDPASGKPVEWIVDAIPGTPEFLPVLGVGLVSGRFFTASDTADAPPVVILSTDLARRLFGERDPLGRTVPAGEKVPEATVVGTVAPVRYSGLRASSEGQLYQPWAQQPLPSGFLVARAVAGHDGLTGTIRRVLAEVDPRIVIASEESIESLVGYEIAAPRFHLILLSVLALLSVTIAGVGLYGVVSQTVTQRAREIGIRMALGATSSAVAGHIVLGGLRLAGVGLCIGVAGAWLVTRGLSAFLYGVSPADPLTYALAAGFLLAIAALAAFAPARRAARIHPAHSLRAE
jgi:putative ABC transport system permease protein